MEDRSRHLQKTSRRFSLRLLVSLRVGLGELIIPG
jgi:hypothetical protein